MGEALGLWCASLACIEDEGGEMLKQLTHLSNLLLLQPSCPGPFRVTRCRSDSVPVSQGMRRSRDSSCDTHTQARILSIARFPTCEWLVLHRGGELARISDAVPNPLMDRSVRDGIEDA